MKKHKSGGILTLLLEIVGLLIIVIGAYVYLRLNTNILSETTVVTNTKCGLSITSHSPNSKVGFPLIIKGVVDNTNSKALGCKWEMFEASENAESAPKVDFSP